MNTTFYASIDDGWYTFQASDEDRAPEETHALRLLVRSSLLSSENFQMLLGGNCARLK